MSVTAEDFNYNLPEELIAQHPLKDRDQSRLLVVDRQSNTITHDIFANVGNHLPKESHFVVNQSRVIPARLLGVKKDSGGQVEVFLLKQVDDHCFEAMLRPLARIKEEHVLDFGHGIECQLVDRDKRIVRFNQPHVLKKLANIGHIPLPPYIKREDTSADHQDYQTVYARDNGSVAAPTAGLHFTDGLIDSLKSIGHQFHALTLHVGYGTFKPVEVDDLATHPMHFESYDVSQAMWDELGKLKQAGHKIISVGTTSTRVLESVAAGMPLQGETNLFIYPPYQFKMVDVLITNFHLPKSTLLMLVSAFGGSDLIKRAYQEAIKAKYRFYSYGDAMIIK